jgi:hypothetical protein
MLELKMILSDKIIPPAEIEPSVPPEMSELVMKALERNRDNRFANAREFAKALSTNCARWLYDSEERAAFMKKLFAARISSTQRLFDSAGKGEREVSDAVEAYRSSSTTQQQAVAAAAVAPTPKNPRPSISGSGRKLKPVAKKEEKPVEEDWRPKREVPRTNEALPKPVSSSKLWPVLGAFVALAAGGGVWLLMQSAPQVEDFTPPPDIPGTELVKKAPVEPDAAVPVEEKPLPTPVVNTPVQTPTPPQNNAKKEKGEVTLALIPEATVTTRAGQKLAEGTLVTFSLPIGTHLVTVIGPDRVKRSLSLRVGAGKNKAQRFRVDDLPPQ